MALWVRLAAAAPAGPGRRLFLASVPGGRTLRGLARGALRLALAVLLASGLGLALAPLGRAAEAPFALTASTFEGHAVLAAMPAEPVALCILFHGSGGGADFAEREEVATILAALAGLGYGVVSTESTDRERKRWDTGTLSPADSPDLARLGRLHRHLVATTALTAEMPVFAMGMSNGAAFAGVFAFAAPELGMNVRAAALYEGPIVAPLLAALDGKRAMPPLFLVLAESDSLVDPMRVREAALSLAGKGYPIEFHLAAERAIIAGDLLSIPGMDEAGAAAVLARLEAEGIIDGAGRQHLWGETRPDLEDFARLRGALEGHPFAEAIRGRLLIAFANHRMRSDFADEQIAFFERYRPGAP